MSATEVQDYLKTAVEVAKQAGEVSHIDYSVVHMYNTSTRYLTKFYKRY